MARPGAFSEIAISHESIKRFFSAIAAEHFFVAFSAVGSIAVGIVAGAFGASPFGNIAAWCGLVALTEATLTAIDRRFKRQPPPEARYRIWAWAKTGLTVSHSMAWGLGPILLHQPGNFISILAPAWAILIFSSAVIYSCASFLPCVIASMVAALAPATIYLALYGDGSDHAVAVCMAASLPFIGIIGFFASRNIRSAVIAQLEVASLLNQAREAQRERARFYSAASHDLRQPVHALGLYAALLPDARGDERGDIERRLVECATSLNRQFDAILGVSEADQATGRATPRVVPVLAILDAVAAQVLPEAEAKGLRLRRMPSSLRVLADTEVLERVVLNLASNAVRYTQRGGVVIGARPSGGGVRLCVADTGIGIAAQDRGHIFEDFYQVANRGRVRERGFGLGLAIVRRLCLAMDWQIDLLSQVGRGSLFSVTVPAARETAATGYPREADLAEDRQRFYPLVVVDDDPLVREAMTRLLARWRVRAEVCATGAEALAALAKRRPGEHWCALVDYRLGDGEDGLALAERLRRQGGDRLRVFLASGESCETLASRSAALGIPVLPKPIKAVRLRALLTAPPQEGGGASLEP